MGKPYERRATISRGEETFSCGDRSCRRKGDGNGGTFTLEELQQSVDRIRNGKAPGPDGILLEIARLRFVANRTYF